MKKVFLIIITASLTLIPTTAMAVEINSEIIRNNCNAARSTIQRIVSSDKTSRINRGRTYDRMSKLLMNFSERLRQNNINNQNFINMVNEFNSKALTFRTDYDNYKNSIDSVVNEECVSRASDFYNALMTARDKRKKVNDDIVALNEIAERYKRAASELGLSLYGD